jgi:uncharacterized membrane protein YphA (DoxX/SURF4 family)
MQAVGEIGIAARIFLALVFAAAAIGKARHMRSFRGTLLDLGIPPGMAWWLAPLVIAYEAILAILLASGTYRSLAAILVVGLLMAFVFVSMIARISRRVVLCSCFGTKEDTLGASTIARSVLLLVPTAAYAYVSTSPLEPTADPLATGVLVSALAAGFLIVGQWILASPRIAALMLRRRQTSRAYPFSSSWDTGSS